MALSDIQILPREPGSKLYEYREPLRQNMTTTKPKKGGNRFTAIMANGSTMTLNPSKGKPWESMIPEEED
jgi:hypothetical protein